jgi:hypothetical protein
MSSSTYTGNAETAYYVEGRKFASFDTSKAFADQLAGKVNRAVLIMEKIPGLPCHVILEIKK